MAWRDSRSSRYRLLFFSISISLGVAAITAIGSFRQNLAQSIDDQARTLIGADLVVESRRPFDSDQEAFLKSLGERQAREVRFNSMIVFPRRDSTRLVNVRALEGEFPFYGTMETIPAAAVRDFRNRKSILVEESLLLQFQAQVGEPVRIGNLEFAIVGSLRKMPGEASAAGSFAPRVYISLGDLAATNLLKQGSIARYRVYVKFSDGTDINWQIGQLTPEIKRLGLEYDTVAKRKKDLGTALENLYRFMNLVGLISLLLGAVGVASAIRAYLQQKTKTGAILRCLGLSVHGTVLIYLVQAAAMGCVGAIAGATLGIAVQRVFPRILKSFLPLAVPNTISSGPILRGMLLGFAICILFALPSLLRFRRLSPLRVLRSDIEGATASVRRDPILWAAYGVIAAGMIAFAGSQMESIRRGLFLAAALGTAIAVFAGVAKLSILGIHRFLPRDWGFVWRQGLANLYRPGNRTLLLTLSLGLGVFLILNIYLSREILLAQFKSVGSKSQANIFLFDIQSDQRTGVAEIIRLVGMPIIQEAPIVTMRLIEIKGRKTVDILADPQRKIPEWELQREYRSTYREQLVETEKIVGGSWIGRIDYHPGDVVPISVDAEIAKDFGAKIGDELIFDVQGVPIKTTIASLRTVDWKRFQTNFFVVFPAGVLENAPTLFVIVSHVSTPADSARLQNAIVARYPNVSAIDLTSIIQTVDSILGKAALVIRVMSLFIVGAGVIVLASTVWTGRYQRLQESILLRTLGASRIQIWKILFAEYFLLGLCASATGIILAVGSSWALAKFFFKLDYVLSGLPIMITAMSAIVLTLVIGLVASRGVTRRPPLEILRLQAE